MNLSKYLVFFTLIFIGLQLSAQSGEVKESFKVWGNCDMCKATIEKAAKSIEGVSTAKWSSSSKKMLVKFDAEKTNLVEIQTAIAASGYDVEGMKASDEAYNKLHNCCQYKRE
jgi:copper chaperone CopZ